MRRRVIAAASATTVVFVLWLLVRSQRDAGSYPIPGEDGPHIRVEVLNGTDVDDLARRTTGLLRRRKIDVVYFGTAAADTFTTTTMLARGADSSYALRVRRVLGIGVVRLAPNPALLLDVSVILGSDVGPVLDLDP